MSNKRILVVEDERIVSLDIQSTLKRIGYEIAGTATTGRQALELAESADPCLILMDIMLDGEMDGIEAARLINRRLDLPVIYLSASSDAHTLERAKRSGSFGYLLKPFDERELYFAIEMALYKHAMERNLKRATMEAESASEAKTAFLATVSHELRTPMNGILGMTDLLLQTEITDEQREYLTLVRDSGMSLLGVLNDILDYSRIEARTMELRTGRFNLKRLLQKALEPLCRQAEKRGLVLDCTLQKGTPLHWRGDSGRLRQVIVNLVHNALNFTEKGGVALDVSLAGEEVIGPSGEFSNREWLHVSVADTGGGISEDQVARVFDSFTQVEDYMTRRRGGLGLGLAISSKLVRLLGGDIWAHGAPGEGAVFEFTAGFTPVRDTGDPSRARTRQAATPLKGARILIVEDDPVNLKFVQTLLSQQGCLTTSAENGRLALAKLRLDRFDLVLMDIQMPVMNGLDCARAIRDPDTGCLDPAVPIVALTAHGAQVEHSECREAGMDDYLSKPVEIPVLLAALGKALKSEICELPEPDDGELDLDGMLHRLGGDEALMHEVLDAFVADIPGKIADLEHALRNGDEQTAARLTHVIRGAAMNTGAGKIKAVAEEIGRLLGKGDMGEGSRLIPMLKRTFDITASRIRSGGRPRERAGL